VCGRYFLKWVFLQVSDSRIETHRRQTIFVTRPWTHILVELASNSLDPWGKNILWSTAKRISTSSRIRFKTSLRIMVVRMFCVDFFSIRLSSISNTKDRVWPHFQTPRRELKIRRLADYFWKSSRCLEMWSNTVLSVWYIFPVMTKT